MKSKSIVFVIALCAGQQSGVVFGSQSNEGWDAWLTNKLREEVAKRHRNPLEAGRDFAMRVGSGLSQKKYPMIDYLLNSQAYVSPIVGNIGLIATGGITAAVLQNIINSYAQGYINYDNAVKYAKDTIVHMLSDFLVYPTRSSKIHALLKRNEWYFGETIEQASQADTSGIIDKACNELIKEISENWVSKQEKERDEPIDLAMADIRKKLINATNLDDQERIVLQDEDLRNFLDLYKKSAVKAGFSIFLRLAQQKVVEKRKPGMFAETTGAVAQQEMPAGYQEKEKKMKHSFSEDELTARARAAGYLGIEAKKEAAKRAAAEE